MKYNKNKRIRLALYISAVSAALLTGFSGFAAEADSDFFGMAEKQTVRATWDFSEASQDIHAVVLEKTKSAAEDAKTEYLKKEEAKRKAAEQKEAEEKAAEAAAAQADKELLAALIFCEAGNQPYEGQVAVGAVVMNRIRSSSYPDTITDVIYQPGQFTPAMTGWLDSVLSSGGYTDSAMKAAEDALAGSNPVGGCLYFSTGGGGYQIGDHFFR